jgi:hypothetical protein
MAAQVMNVKIERINHELHRMVIYCKCDTTGSTWTDATTTPYLIKGEIVCVDTVPGETAPQLNYDPVLKNAEGIDIMFGALANRSNANPERAYPAYLYQQAYYIVPAPVKSTLEVEMSGNNVNGADWTMYVYFRKKETARG